MAIDPKTTVRPCATQHFQSLIGGHSGKSKFIDLVAAKEKHTPTTSTYSKTSQQDQAAKEVAKAPSQQVNSMWRKA